MVVEEINYPICSPMYSNDYDECSHCIIKDWKLVSKRNKHNWNLQFLADHKEEERETI